MNQDGACGADGPTSALGSALGARPAQPGYAAGTMPLDTEGTGSFAAQTGAALSRVPRAPASRSELPCLGRPV